MRPLRIISSSSFGWIFGEHPDYMWPHGDGTVAPLGDAPSLIAEPDISLFIINPKSCSICTPLHTATWLAGSDNQLVCTRLQLQNSHSSAADYTFTQYTMHRAHRVHYIVYTCCSVHVTECISPPIHV